MSWSKLGGTRGFARFLESSAESMRAVQHDPFWTPYSYLYSHSLRAAIVRWATRGVRDPPDCPLPLTATRRSAHGLQVRGRRGPHGVVVSPKLRLPLPSGRQDAECLYGGLIGARAGSTSRPRPTRVRGQVSESRELSDVSVGQVLPRAPQRRVRSRSAVTCNIRRPHPANALEGSPCARNGAPARGCRRHNQGN